MTDSTPAQTLTFLFTDIEGSTPLWDRDPHAMRRATERHNALLREAIAARGGQAFRVVGDAFCVAFVDASSAVLAAIDAQRALSAHPWGDASIRVRMGLHSGAVEPTGDEIFRGPALARAARVMDAAHGEQILATAATIALLDQSLPAGSTLRDLGDHTLRGFARPERIYELVVPGLRSEFPPIRTREAQRTNLPTALTSFIGRERALADVRAAAVGSRLVSLTGAGGTGKTRLMIESAAALVDMFPDGVWLIELAALADPGQMAQTIAAALGARAEGDVTALALVEGVLAGKRSLVLLDNCEHVIDEAARVVQNLLRALPHLHVMTTSREALGIDGEVIYRVPSLMLPAADSNAAATSASEAALLFVERAQAVVPGFRVTDRNAAAVTQICRRLDGIPLALELAAARLTALSVDELAARLHDRFRILTGGRRSVLPRQRTLRALVDWSYDLLSDDERAVMRVLAVFAGGFTLEAAERVCNGESSRTPGVLDAVVNLVDKSLLVAEHDQDAETRYRMLETIRQYAAEKLVDAGEADATRRRHFDYFLHLAERAEPHLRESTVLEWLDRLESEHDNLRAALDWSGDVDSPGHARLAGALHAFWDIRGHFAEGYERLERALALHVADDAARLKVLLGTAGRAYRLDFRQRSESLLEETIALAQRLGDSCREGEALLLRAIDVDFRGPDVIEPLVRRGHELSEAVGNLYGIGLGILLLGRIAMMRGRLAEAQRLFLESGAMCDRGGCVIMAAEARTWAGQCAIERLDYDRARTLLEHALAEHRRLGNVHDAGTTLRALGQLDLNVGRFEEALREGDESARIFRTLHDPNCGARTALVCAGALHATGEHALALIQAEEAGAVSARLGFHENAAAAKWLAGRSHEAKGDRGAARRAYFEGLRESAQSTSRAGLPRLLEAVGGLHANAPVAPRLLGLAAALLESSNTPVFPAERADVERWRAAVRAAHDPLVFDRLFTEGRTSRHEDAIAEALALEVGA